MTAVSGIGRHYLQARALINHYRELKEDQEDHNTWNFWLNALRFYFPTVSGPKKQPKGLQYWCSYLTIMHSLEIGKMIYPVHIRNFAGKPAFSEEDWTAAKDELTDFMIIDRDDRPKDSKPAIRYGMLNVGAYTRFYELDPTASEVHDYVGSGIVYDTSRPLEVAEDVDTIHAILEDMSKLAWD